MHYNFHQQILNLRKRFITLGSMVECRVHKSCSLIKSHDETTIKTLIETDYEIDEMEIEIEEECLKILALYQPVAVDLRFLVAVIKINNELERIADYAVKIAKRVHTIDKDSGISYPFDYTPMVNNVLIMLKTSLDSLVKQDSDLAHHVFVMDDEVDKLCKKSYDILCREITQQPDHASGLINNYLLARHLERIGDRSTNIAEEVIYMVGGTIVRGEHN